MKVQMQPKTIEDYRDLTKVLKLKIVKQSKIIQQLEQKCKKYEEDINSATFRMGSREQINLVATKGYEQDGNVKEQQLNTLKGKSHVMRKFLRGAHIFGISPESIYRIADIFYTNCIESDYFRTILSKMVLNLSPKQVSCLIFIFDQNCLGYISKQDYDNSLHAYQVGVEQACLPYTQECLLKLCSIFHSQRTDLNKFYDEMKTQAKNKNNGNVDLTIFQDQIKKYFTGKIQEREIMGSFNQINLQKQRSIQKKNFLYGVNSFTNRLMTEPISNSNLKNSRSQLRSQLKVPVNANKTSTISMGGVTNSFLKNPPIELGQESPIDKLLHEKNIKFEDIVSSMAEMKIKSRLSIHQFKKCFDKLSKQITSEDISIIFRALDINHEGSIHIFDAINFTLKHFKDPHVVFKLLGKSFQIYQISPEQFWGAENFQDPSRLISKSKFIEIMANQCSTPEPQSWQVVWNFFDKGKGTISIHSVLDVWKKYLLE